MYFIGLVFHLLWDITLNIVVVVVIDQITLHSYYSTYSSVESKAVKMKELFTLPENQQSPFILVSVLLHL